MQDTVRRPKFKGYAVFPLGRALEQARRELGLQPEDLARALNLELKQIEALEIGEIPSLEVLQRIDTLVKGRNAVLGRSYVDMAQAVLTALSGTSSPQGNPV